MTTAIFLGAGASAAEGAPLQSELFHQYFAGSQGAHERMRGRLAQFFDLMFSIDVGLAKVAFPTFEEALGILDLAELRRESLRGLSLDATAAANIRTTRQDLVFAMAQVIAGKLAGPIPGQHKKLVEQLKGKGKLANTIFITTNYDILIDNALLDSPQQGTSSSMIDYGVEFTNFDVAPEVYDEWRWNRPDPNATKLYKLHGSLNWLYCPTCNSLTVTPGMKAVLSVDDSRATCMVCHSLRTLIIVPPTFYKDMSRVFLSTVWNKAESALRKVDHLIMCGYSFPDADMHIKYLLKRIQTNRNDQNLRVTVINNRPHKEGTEDPDPCECYECSPQASQRKKDEEIRYRRFFGPVVENSDFSFQDFAKDPSSFFP